MDTTIQVPSEAEMSAFEQTWRKMQDALTAGSALEQKFNALTSEVEGLRRDLQSLRNTNMALDDALTVSRQQRDKLQGELSEVRVERNSKVQELEHALHERHEKIKGLEIETSLAQERINSLMDHLESARNERDSAQFRVLELTEESERLRKQVADVTEVLGKMQQLLHPIQAITDAPTGKVEPEVKVEVAENKVVTLPAEVPQNVGESREEYHGRVGRYPSEREARAAAQPREPGGQFTSEEPLVAQGEPINKWPY